MKERERGHESVRDGTLDVEKKTNSTPIIFIKVFGKRVALMDSVMIAAICVSVTITASPRRHGSA